MAVTKSTIEYPPPPGSPSRGTMPRNTPAAIWRSSMECLYILRQTGASIFPALSLDKMGC